MAACLDDSTPLTYYPSTRKEAKQGGYKYYFTGKPCKQGHISVRQRGGACVQCNNNNADAWKEKNRDHVIAYSKQYREENREHVLARGRQYWENHKDYFMSKNREYREEHKEYVLELGREYYAKHRGYLIYLSRLRQAKKLDATPTWADIERIKDIYKRCPKGYEVDHIIPLQGETVCGLHVADNLQYLAKEENISKSNKLDDPNGNGIDPSLIYVSGVDSTGTLG